MIYHNSVSQVNQLQGAFGFDSNFLETCYDNCM